MPDTPEGIARRVALRLAAEMDPALPGAVERRLAGDEAGPPARYLDPATLIALGGLLVSVSQFAWTIYRDLKKETESPSGQVLDRRIRVSVELPAGVTAAQRDRLIGVVVEEVVGGSATS